MLCAVTPRLCLKSIPSQVSQICASKICKKIFADAHAIAQVRVHTQNIYMSFTALQEYFTYVEPVDESRPFGILTCRPAEARIHCDETPSLGHGDPFGSCCLGFSAWAPY